MKLLRLLWAAAAAACFALPAFAQPNLGLVDMGSGSPFDQVSLNSINKSGHMSGYGVVPGTGEIHAFIYANGVYLDLGLLGYQASDGIALNNLDQLAADGIGPGSTALLYSGGSSRRLGSVDGGYTSAYAIDDSGDVVGTARNGDGNLVGFSWIGGMFTDLSTVGLYRAVGINDARQIVGSIGYYWVYGGYGHSSAHGALYSGGVVTDIGSLTGNPRTNTEAYAINASGQVVGYSQAADGTNHAVLYSGGPLQDLGTLYGANAAAIAINSSGTVIGNLTNPYGANLGAFLYTGGVMYDLASLITQGGDGWTGLTVSGLNDDGWIVGNGTVNGEQHGFVLRPAQVGAAGAPATAPRSRIASIEPSPFRTTATVAFEISSRGSRADAELAIFDATGRRIATLLRRRLAPGSFSVVWDGRGAGGERVAAGVYFARLRTGDGAATRRAVLLR